MRLTGQDRPSGQIGGRLQSTPAMIDLLYLFVTTLFFVLCILYAKGCEAL